MNKTISILAGVSFAVSSFAQVSNGSFETNTWNGSGYDALFTGDSASLASWLVLGNMDSETGAPLSGVDIVSSPYPVFDGNFAVDLAGTPGPGGISQLLTLSAGTYDVTFAALFNPYADPINMTIFAGLVDPSLANGSNLIDPSQLNLITVTSTGPYGIYGFEATVTGNSLLVLETDPNNHTNGNIFVDAVNAQAVPEPISMTLLGLGGLSLVRRRK
jgi:hypothetical protein